MKSALSENTVVVLGNANELAVNIIQGVMGNEIADSIGDSPVTRDVIYNMVQTEFQKKLAPTVGAAT
jgi:hypothetical protein